MGVVSGAMAQARTADLPFDPVSQSCDMGGVGRWGLLVIKFVLSSRN